jgi:hypothetical protein
MPFALPFVAATALFASFANMGAMAVKISLLTAAVQALPVLSCVGETFAGRVAASLLTAIGLPDMITENMDDYENLAVQFARSPDRLRNVKERLVANRRTHPLFDAPLYTAYIEAAYLEMQTRFESGCACHTFHVHPGRDDTIRQEN